MICLCLYTSTLYSIVTTSLFFLLNLYLEIAAEDPEILERYKVNVPILLVSMKRYNMNINDQWPWFIDDIFSSPHLFILYSTLIFSVALR